MTRRVAEKLCTKKICVDSLVPSEGTADEKAMSNIGCQ